MPLEPCARPLDARQIEAGRPDQRRIERKRKVRVHVGNIRGRALAHREGVVIAADGLQRHRVLGCPEGARTRIRRDRAPFVEVTDGGRRLARPELG
jgi:hypothetical protein